ncbi:putative helix-turn-helix protein, YlxM/p13 family protein [Alkaliphilus metalliredigens QYMF]|uniref:UPF0122 protein Amet_2748 n=1 Tax=Alkaliphilus metalliredigens (strain QYMF) TaxID=293826 RepID=A6TRT1_ALKMQ|nr:putative DNA-binding protein [Alkaliphilus metalliredigens]ABR48899.1 putative helix-turn-helix protein, YlxM/p13 family protein [Alkaliphilus metalliredigens QYMF]
MIEKTIQISMLYDFYNQLLTQKQREMVDLYHNQDLSLSEIAEEFEISRQAVYDTIKRTEKILYDYEEKLKLLDLFTNKTHGIEKIYKHIVILEGLMGKNQPLENQRAQIENIKDLLNKLLSN